MAFAHLTLATQNIPATTEFFGNTLHFRDSNGYVFEVVDAGRDPEC